MDGKSVSTLSEHWPLKTRPRTRRIPYDGREVEWFLTSESPVRLCLCLWPVPNSLCIAITDLRWQQARVEARPADPWLVVWGMEICKRAGWGLSSDDWLERKVSTSRAYTLIPISYRKRRCIGMVNRSISNIQTSTVVRLYEVGLYRISGLPPRIGKGVIQGFRTHRDAERPKRILNTEDIRKRRIPRHLSIA